MSINRVEISGNLGGDPELKSTASGMAVCTFSICVNDRRKSKQTGEWENVPNWVDVVFFGNRANSIGRYLFKGSLVFVAGRLHQNKWQDKNGNIRSKLEVIGEDIQFASSNQRGGQDRQQDRQQGYQQQDPGYQGQYPAGGDMYDEDIPF